jgi:lipoprotein-anchoring transpeptidase ErfK/SrfK
MRRRVVISEKSKVVAICAALALSLTSIHLAAKAHIASLQRELAAVSTQQSAFSQDAQVAASQPSIQLQSNGAAIHQEAVASKSKPSETSSAPAAIAHSVDPAPKRQIIISIADRQLAVIEQGQVLKTYPIAVGARGTPSPDGDFVIINHAKDPVYRHGDKEIAPGKDNPLGTRWMGLSLKGYGIHGTNVQSSVGKAISHGCFRMRKQDVEELYALVQVGDTVMVRRERDAMIAKVFTPPSSMQPAVTLANAAPGSDIQVATINGATTVETTEQ